MDIVLRATVMFAVLYGLLRLLGKRELSQMTPFELVLLVVMGDLIQQGVTHNDFSMTGAALAIVTFAFWSLMLNLISFWLPGTERILEGKPAVLISAGEPVSANLRRNRMTLPELEAEMRLAGIGSMTEVAWAILETEGKISFIRRKDPDQSALSGSTATVP